ncbi:hypothetical protein QUF74_10465 [Candidatus Halobeggiatoa sp. HSG11]|nr:hypothetical protein [Candidatus Halobeggiatoa sp. HSG11]
MLSNIDLAIITALAIERNAVLSCFHYKFNELKYLPKKFTKCYQHYTPAMKIGLTN